MNEAERTQVEKAYWLIHQGFTGDRSSLYQSGQRLKEMTEGLEILKDLVMG